MDLSIRRFGRPSREMVGVHQKAHGESPARARFLLCRPLGQEAVRTAPVFRVMAEKLAREGCDSLRFEYHGTGDSPGEESEQSLSGWIQDTLAAHEQLLPGTGVQVHWFGMGLGATLALRAAILAKNRPRHLLLWEPVLNGRAYEQALLSAHRAELTREFGHPWPRLLRMRKVTEPTLPGGVLGFEIGERLAHDLRELRDLTVSPALRLGIKVTCAVHEELRPHFSGLEGNALLRMHTIETRTNWMLSQALGKAIVPPDLPRAVLSTLE